MDERKLQLQENFQKFKAECEYTVSLLQNLVCLNEQSIASIDQLEECWLLTHPKYLLEVNSFQYLLHHKLLSLNLELEAFYKNIMKNKVTTVKPSEFHPVSTAVCKQCNKSQQSSSSCCPPSSNCRARDWPHAKPSIPSMQYCNCEPAESAMNASKCDSCEENIDCESEMETVPIETVKRFVSDMQHKTQNLKWKVPCSRAKDVTVLTSYLTGVNLNRQKANDSKIFCTKVTNNTDTPNTNGAISKEIATSVILVKDNTTNSETERTESNGAEEDPNIKILSDPDKTCNVFSSKPISLPNINFFYSLTSSDASVGENRDLQLQNVGESSMKDILNVIKNAPSKQESLGDKGENDCSYSEYMARMAQDKDEASGGSFCVNTFRGDQSKRVACSNWIEADSAEREEEPCPVLIDAGGGGEETKEKDKEDDKGKSRGLESQNFSEPNGPEGEQLVLDNSRLFPLESKVLESPRLPKVGDVCMVLYTVSPDHFYIQVGDENSIDFDVMENDLNDHYSKTAQTFISKSEAQICIERYCAAFVDKRRFFYRAEVVDWFESEQEYVLVKLVDYGPVEKVSIKNLRILKGEFCDLPKIAYRCHLESLYPPESTYHERLTQWPRKAISYWHKVLGDIENNVFEIYLVRKDENRDSIGIDIIQENKDLSVGQMLINKGQAVEILERNETLVCNNSFMKEQIKRAQGLSGITSDMSKDEILDTYFANNKIIEPVNINDAVMHYDPKDEARTCRFQRPDGTCFKGNRCKLRHTPLPKDGFTADKQPVYIKAFNGLEYPAPGSTVTVRILHIVDIEWFYVHLISSLTSIEFSPAIFFRRMNGPDTIKKYRKFRDSPCMAEIVIVKHEDHNWCRARVCDIMEDSTGHCFLQVFLVDFGETVEDVDLKNVRKILPELLDFPFQAVECHLYNVKHKIGIERNVEREYFEERYLGENVIARIIDNPGHLEVLLFDDRGGDIGSKLVKAGFGEFKNDSIFPSPEQGLLID